MLQHDSVAGFRHTADLPEPLTIEELGEQWRIRFREAYSQRHIYPEAREIARDWVESLRDLRNRPAYYEEVVKPFEPRSMDELVSVALYGTEVTWRDRLSLGNLMRFGAFWVVLGIILRLLFG
jgi:hypothetical protein